MDTNRMTKTFIICSLMLASSISFAQNIGINTTGAVPDAGAGLDVNFTNKGVLVPRVNIADLSTIAPVVGSSTESLLVYNTNATTGVGYHYWNGSRWVRLAIDGDAWKTTGNAGTNAGTNFLGTTDNNALRIRTNNGNRFEFTTNGRLRSFSQGAAGTPTYSWTADPNTGIWRPGNDILGFSTAGAERMRIDNNGAVGIGTTTPFVSPIGGANVQRLHVSSNATPVGSGMSEFINSSATGTAVGVANTNAANNQAALEGSSLGTGTGIRGLHLSAAGVGTGVSGSSNSVDGTGVIATNTNNGTGLQAAGGNIGIISEAYQQNNASIGVLGLYSGGGNFDAVGVRGQTISNAGFGIGGFFIGNWRSVQALGDMVVIGNFTATGAKAFTIDHPEDPENKMLRHFSIESNEVLNVYRGNVFLDEDGKATVLLPSYFDDININFSYNLTSIGVSNPNLFISREVNNGSFEIAGGTPGSKISWNVYAERNDEYFRDHPEAKLVEVAKTEKDKKYPYNHTKAMEVVKGEESEIVKQSIGKRPKQRNYDN